MQFAKVIDDKVVVELPVELLKHAFNNGPFIYKEGVKINCKDEFAKGFVQYINNFQRYSEGGTEFQEMIDNIFVAMIENAVPYIDYPDDY